MQQTSLQTSNVLNKMSITRPSPTDSATLFAVGYQKLGNDGRTWQVIANTAGIQRWVPVNSNVPPVPSTPGYVYKFNIGDEVEINVAGWGCSTKELYKRGHIIEKGDYYGTPGYKITNTIGNMLNNSLFIGEGTFKLVTPTSNTPNNTQIKPKMAKTKSITKKTTQEVRQIETSLINKEEVFKMLALAEATGLPLLLIGEPGVNSK